ncbi:hypothetical protein RhiirC2_719027 [Rhizophagus irregularis]|uniref:Uncharacterized protein n=1 Tax=Rhizophagus irregularis TaxID=588596 RepID=A0A2N1MFX6_9GLOM|nr:hypothetical protein RhiirC2_719027 [Rhizophagus irregularis]
MARVFDNTDASRSAKKSGLKTVQAKLGLLNSALYATYGLKLKATNKKNSYYHLVSSFDSRDAPKLPLYQTGEEIYWENGKDTRYAFIFDTRVMLGKINSDTTSLLVKKHQLVNLHTSNQKFRVACPIGDGLWRKFNRLPIG